MIYSVFSTNQDELKAAVESAFRDASLLIAPGYWLVSGNGTSSDISKQLGVGTKGLDAALVVMFAGYNGRQPTPVWEWIKTKWESA
jgi:hypothetical protein